MNASHIDMDILRKHCRDELLVDFSQKPRYGYLDVVGQRSNRTALMKVAHLLTGRTLIYRHRKEEVVLPDEILLHIVSKNDASRRTSRLRVILPVIMMQQKDLLLKVAFIGLLNLIIKNSKITRGFSVELSMLQKYSSITYRIT